MSSIFQFHKGAIRTPSRFFDSLSDRYFNSIKVRLELPEELYHLNILEFQFHKGAIRTAQIAYQQKVNKISIP